MKKSTIYTTLLLSTLALNQAVLADEIIAPADDQPGIVTPSEPSQPVTPTTPTGPATSDLAEPAPADPGTPGGTEPTQPVQPTEPVAPVQPNQPTDPVSPLPDQPTQPSQPITPAEPTQPTTPATPTEPSQPTTPSSPAPEPGQQTTAPAVPTNPSAPVAPSAEPAAAGTRAGAFLSGTQNRISRTATQVKTSDQTPAVSQNTEEDAEKPQKTSNQLTQLPDTGTADSSLLSFLGATALGLIGLAIRPKNKKNSSI